MEHITICIFSYLIGSIPFGFILTKYFLKKDIREIGSGNIGATNALRTGNKLIGYSTLLLDISKAILVVIFIKINYQEFIYVASLCVFLGHVFPVWLKFKGGKGVATYVGILFSINILLGIVFLISWLLIFIISKYSSLSSLAGTLSVPIYLTITGQTNSIIFSATMFILIFFTHRENVKRLKNKEENKTKIY
jgi:acyl phosphate:glycerol-3-phosphate acyltransferase